MNNIDTLPRKPMRRYILIIKENTLRIISSWSVRSCSKIFIGNHQVWINRPGMEKVGGGLRSHLIRVLFVIALLGNLSSFPPRQPLWASKSVAIESFPGMIHMYSSLLLHHSCNWWCVLQFKLLMARTLLKNLFRSNVFHKGNGNI